MTRSIRFILLILFLLTAACQEKPEKKAEQFAREQMIRTIGLSAVNRSHIEVHPSGVGWLVIFRDANASCVEGSFWPGACRFGAKVFRDVYACVEHDWNIGQIGASGASESLGSEDLCQAPLPGATTEPLPTAAPHP